MMGSKADGIQLLAFTTCAIFAGVLASQVLQAYYVPVCTRSSDMVDGT